MESILNFLGTAPAQALLTTAVQAALSTIGGGDPAEAAAAFQEAVSGYAGAVSAWQAAEAAKPARDA